MAVIDLIPKESNPLMTSGGEASLASSSQNVLLSGTSYHNFSNRQTINYSLISYNPDNMTIQVRISCTWAGGGFVSPTTSYTTTIQLG